MSEELKNDGATEVAEEPKEETQTPKQEPTELTDEQKDQAIEALKSVGIDPESFMKAKKQEQDDVADSIRERLVDAIRPMLDEARDAQVGMTCLIFFDTDNRSALQKLANQSPSSKTIGNMMTALHNDMTDMREKQKLSGLMDNLLGGGSIMDALGDLLGGPGDRDEDPNEGKGDEATDPVEPIDKDGA